jgi:hypothetical protein
MPTHHRTIPQAAVPPNAKQAITTTFSTASTGAAAGRWRIVHRLIHEGWPLEDITDIYTALLLAAEVLLLEPGDAPRNPEGLSPQEIAFAEALAEEMTATPTVPTTTTAK